MKLPAAGGREISALWRPNPSAAYVVLFSYGNGEDLAGDLPFLGLLRAHGWAVCGYDYPGYGGSPGSPSPAGCIAAIGSLTMGRSS